MHADTYRGRFAPSPTGKLHLGSLTVALASYLQARYYDGVWLLRIDDIDPPREVAGSADSIIGTLAALGLSPDEPVIYQSRNSICYRQAIAELQQINQVYYCSCSRSELPADGRYTGKCRQGPLQPEKPQSIRLKCKNQNLDFVDKLQGTYTSNLCETSGDFIVQRKDGYFAYQLCCALDDAKPGITEVVRGADLLDSTPQQIYIRQCLGLASPAYLHIPLVNDADGNKLSKSDAADPLQYDNYSAAVRMALLHLNHPPPASIQTHEGLLKWALAHWQPGHLHHTTR